MQHLYLGAVAFGITLLAASFLLHGGKDTDHGGGGHHAGGAATGLAWAPFGSLRFWVFFFTFGGGAGIALTQLRSSQLVTGISAVAIGWISGAMAVTVIRKMTRTTVSSDVAPSDIVGTTGTLVLPVGPGQPGKVRVEVRGRTEDFVANLVEEGGNLPTGSTVLIVAEGDLGSLLVTKHDV